MWLPGVELTERRVTAGRRGRFDIAGGSTRLSVQLYSKGIDRCDVAVEEEKSPDAGSAAERRAYWRERLAVLKARREA